MLEKKIKEKSKKAEEIKEPPEEPEVKVPIENEGESIKEEIPQNDTQNQINMDNRQFTPKENFNNIQPKERDYERINPRDNRTMMQNEIVDNNYQRMPPNNYDNRPLPRQDINYQNDNRNYPRSPYYENNYRRMTPSNHGYNRNDEYNQIPPDHYSEPDKRYQNIQHDFDRQYNYIDNRDQNNYNQRDGDYNGNRDPYARPDYYANNRPRTMG